MGNCCSPYVFETGTPPSTADPALPAFYAVVGNAICKVATLPTFSRQQTLCDFPRSNGLHLHAGVRRSMHPCLVHCQLKARQPRDIKLVYPGFIRVVPPSRLQIMRRKWAMTSPSRDAREVI